MRIGFFYKHYEANGGFPRDWRRFACELADLGEEVTVYTYENRCRTASHPNVRVKRYPGSSGSSFFLPPALERDLKDDARRLDILEVVGAYFPENVTIARLAVSAGTPYVVCPLGHLAPKIVGRNPVKKLLFIHAFLRRVMQRAIAMHLFSEQEGAWVGRYAKGPAILTALGSFIEDIPDHLDTSYLRKQLGCADAWPLMLYLGRLDAVGKGLATLIDAIAMIRDRLPGARMVLIGPDHGRDRQLLDAQIQARDLADRITLLPPCYGPEKFNAMASADLFVYPSNYDVIPRSIREALSVGCPVLASEESHVGNLLRSHRAGVATSIDAGALGDAILALASDRGALRGMRADARRAARVELDWRAQAVRLRDGYRRVLETRDES